MEPVPGFGSSVLGVILWWCGPSSGCGVLESVRVLWCTDHRNISEDFLSVICLD